MTGTGSASSTEQFVVSTIDELKCVLKDPSKFCDEYVGDIVSPIEHSTSLWLYLIFTSDESNIETLSSNLLDIFKARGVDIKLDLSSKEVVHEVRKFIIEEYPYFSWKEN